MQVNTQHKNNILKTVDALLRMQRQGRLMHIKILDYMSYISTMHLHVLDHLFIEKEKEMKQLTGNLQLREVKEDTHFNAAVKRIKQHILLTPVTIEEPKITGNYQTTRQVPANYQNLWGGSQNINVITVEFPCSGSSELFKYRASGVALSMGKICLPSYNTIPVEVQLTELNKTQALSKAKEEMAITFELIRQNNPYAERWSAQMQNQIDALAQQKRKELLEFYS